MVHLLPLWISKSVSITHSLLRREIANVLSRTAAKQVLNGTISEKGILAPMNSKINDPLMKELKEKYGLVFLSQFLRSSLVTELSELNVRRKLSHSAIRHRPN